MTREQQADAGEKKTQTRRGNQANKWDAQWWGDGGKYGAKDRGVDSQSSNQEVPGWQTAGRARER